MRFCASSLLKTSALFYQSYSNETLLLLRARQTTVLRYLLPLCRSLRHQTHPRYNTRSTQQDSRTLLRSMLVLELSWPPLKTSATSPNYEILDTKTLRSRHIRRAVIRCRRLLLIRQHSRRRPQPRVNTDLSREDSATVLHRRCWVPLPHCWRKQYRLPDNTNLSKQGI